MRINSFTQRNGLHLDNLRGTFKLKQTDSKIKRLILKPFLAIKDRAYLVIRPFIKEEPPIVKQQVAKVSKSIASGIKKTAEVSKAKLSRGAKSAKDFIEKNQLIFIELTTITAIALGLIYRSHKHPGSKKLLPKKEVSQKPSDLRSVIVATTAMIFTSFTSSFLREPPKVVEKEEKFIAPEKTNFFTKFRRQLRRKLKRKG